jgi:6-phosphogluconolactonase (cycloisomerase 2 family)
MAENNENPELQQGQPQAFAPFPGPGAGGATTDPPSWAVPPARKPVRRRRGLTVALALALTLVVAVGTALVTSSIVDGPAPAAAEQPQDEPADQQPAPPAAQQESAPPNVQPVPRAATGDLREGAVFVQSNDVVSNDVVAFARKADGTLRELGRFPTGGVGSGSFEDAAQGLVLGTAEGEASPIQNVDQAELLFAANAGSSTISVFRVNSDGLDLISHVPSGGKRPVSLTVNNGLLYVLNSGESDRRLVLGPNNFLDNCSHGDRPSVTGFRITGSGGLTPIEDSTRSLGGRGSSGCSQVSFTPDGETLIVTERTATMPGQTKDKKGVITTFDVRFDGALGARRLIDPSGTGPFGFNFLKDGTLIVAEQNGALANPGGGGAVSYQVNSDKSLQPINGTVDNGQTDTCWIVVTDDQKLAFAANAFTGGSITSYRVRDDGGLELLHPLASAPDGRDANNDLVQDGLTDMALSRDTSFLYQLNSIDGTLWVFRVNPDGLLSHIETHNVFDLEPFGMGGEAAPFGISAW